MTSARATSSSCDRDRPELRRGGALVAACLAALACVSIATALDFAIAIQHGYRLRTEQLTLIGIDAALLALGSLPVLALLAATRFVPHLPDLAARLPRSCVLAAAAAPLAPFALARAEGALALGLFAVAALALLAFAALEWRLARPASWISGVATLAVAWGLLTLFAHGDPPGSQRLHEPGPASGARASREAPNVLLIVLDTLRADHLGLYGYSRPVSPWLDEFAESATVFERAHSSSSWTLPAHATLFTGLNSRSHGADLIDKGDPGGMSPAELGRLEDVARAKPLSAEAVTLAEIARDAGLETGAMCANTAYLYRMFGLDQGFDTYVDDTGVSVDWRPIGLSIGDRLGLRDHWQLSHLVQSNERYYLLGSEINELALRWLEPRRDRRFFLFLNYMDAHAPYLPIGRYQRLFPQAWGPQSVEVDAIRSRERAMRDDEREALVDPYDAEIRYLDDELARLFAKLREWELLENTLVVFVADHGEAFGEHDEIGHGNGVYQPEVHVPLLVRLPGQRQGDRVDRFVHLVDVAPTLLRAAGLPEPPGLEGTSLLELNGQHAGVTYTGRYADLVEQHPERYDRTHWALFRDPWKLIRRSDGDTELYDLRQDPRESRNLAPERPDVVARLTESLDRYQEEVEPRFDDAVEAPTDEGTLERLRALGYAE
jgi:arylsulfatase A-like enzyme